MSERDNLIEILHKEGAYCGLCDYESRGCKDCDMVLGQYADAILGEGYRKVELDMKWEITAPGSWELPHEH